MNKLLNILTKIIIKYIIIKQLTIRRVEMSYTYNDLTRGFGALELIKHTLYGHFADSGRLHPKQTCILEYLIGNPGCTQAELAGELMVTPASITLTTQRMEKDGLITKAAHSDNLRCNELFITDKGKEVFKYNLSLFEKIDGVMFGGLSEDEILKFSGALEALKNNALKNCRTILSEKELKKLSHISKNKTKGK